MGENVLKIIFRVNFTDVDATTGMLTAYERDRKDKVWKGVSLKQNYIACKFIVNIKVRVLGGHLVRILLGAV